MPRRKKTQRVAINISKGTGRNADQPRRRLPPGANLLLVGALCCLALYEGLQVTAGPSVKFKHSHSQGQSLPPHRPQEQPNPVQAKTLSQDKRYLFEFETVTDYFDNLKAFSERLRQSGITSSIEDKFRGGKQCSLVLAFGNYFPDGFCHLIQSSLLNGWELHVVGPDISKHLVNDKGENSTNWNSFEWQLQKARIYAEVLRHIPERCIVWIPDAFDSLATMQSSEATQRFLAMERATGKGQFHGADSSMFPFDHPYFQPHMENPFRVASCDRGGAGNSNCKQPVCGGLTTEVVRDLYDQPFVERRAPFYEKDRGFKELHYRRFINGGFVVGRGGYLRIFYDRVSHLQKVISSRYDVACIEDQAMNAFAFLSSLDDLQFDEVGNWSSARDCGSSGGGDGGRIGDSGRRRACNSPAKLFAALDVDFKLVFCTYRAHFLKMREIMNQGTAFAHGNGDKRFLDVIYQKYVLDMHPDYSLLLRGKEATLRVDGKLLSYAELPCKPPAPW